MPLFSFFFLSFSLANMGLPGLSNFVGEALVLVGAFKTSPAAAFFGATGMVFSAGYSLWLYNRICLGGLKIKYVSRYLDLTGFELAIFVYLLVLVVLLGIYPGPVLSVIRGAVSLLVYA